MASMLRALERMTQSPRVEPRPDNPLPDVQWSGGGSGVIDRIRGVVVGNPALFSMPALLIVFLAATVAIHPTFDSFDAQSLAMAALPLACAAAAQAVVVISGGIDLSIGSVMAVANVLAASTMKHAGFGEALLLAVAILVAGAAVGMVNGLLVLVSRVPDVIVTLTTGFIWGGVALLILEKPVVRVTMTSGTRGARTRSPLTMPTAAPQQGSPHKQKRFAEARMLHRPGSEHVGPP